MSFQYKTNNNFTKKQRYRGINHDLINYIYTTLDISKFKYEILNSEEQLNRFISDVYYISPNFCGKNCFLIFIKIKTHYYSCLIDKKQLSYNYEKVNTEKVFIHHCNVDVDLSLYNGTIFDGIYIKKDGINEYIITDVYYFKGTDYTTNKLKHKLFEIKMYLDNIGTQIKYNHNKIHSRTELTLTVNDICDLTNIRRYIESDIKKYNNYQIRGLCFYPEISGTKLIHLYSNNNNKVSNINKKHVNSSEINVSGKNKTNLYRSNRLVKKTFIAKNDETIYAILEMKATNTVDNYKMYAVEKVIDDGRTKLKKYQMDIAYISSIKKSNWVRDIINNSSKGSVFVKCIWRDDKHKWEPLELAKNVRLPSLMDDILIKIMVMEESESDSD